tara:strand:+ start:7134 stop:7745 length:612 start_codon:yes stop_codon:yes gene_type:complete
LKKNKISKNWINKQRRDIYVRKSKIEGYRSRAVYKLEEINNKFKFLKNGLSVVDLGAAPGSWSQYMSKNYKKMRILAIDLKKIDKIDNIFQLTGDFTEKVNQKKIKEYFHGKVDLVVSDMAANTSGNKNLDSIVTGELCLEALEFTKNIIKKDGQFVSKLFMGTTFNEIVKYSKEIFEEINIFKPPASKKDSKENFLVCKKLR